MTMIILFALGRYMGIIQTAEHSILFFAIGAALKSHMAYNSVRVLENKVDDLNK